MSSGTISGEHSWSKQETFTYRQFFKARWREFIRAQYESPAHVAHVWKVDPATAANWWEGITAPQGWAVAKAMSDPSTKQQASEHLAGSSQCQESLAD